jgi:hypothetical protein
MTIDVASKSDIERSEVVDVFLLPSLTLLSARSDLMVGHGAATILHRVKDRDRT